MSDALPFDETQTRHRLAPLLAPRSVALVGASARPRSVGADMIEVLAGGGFAGRIDLVNPRYDRIGERPCYPDLESLPGVALARAKELAHLGANRELYAEQKERLFGENAVLDGPHGPAHMLKHSADFR